MKKTYLVDYDSCNLRFCGRQCIKKCPIKISNEKNKSHIKKQDVPIWLQKSTNQIKIKEDRCLKCGICLNVCPANAIYVKNILEEPSNLIPTHKYPVVDGKEGFRLYNLPNLISGKVTGLCGPNGIGKTTVLNIVSGNLKPNFGEYELGQDQTPWQKLIPKFKESEMRNHFLLLSHNDRKIAYKQQVLRILFEKYKDTCVSDILNSENEVSQNFFKKIQKYLDIDAISDRFLEECSGGELQRFSIGSVLIKEADIYIIDEPCTFLDVQKRIKLAQLFHYRCRGFDKERPCPILVVEHDLAILDYISDIIQLFYGIPYQFGIISNPMTTKKGINAYLDGFLKSENIEFRNTKYGFRRSTSGRTWSNAKIFAEYGKISKTFDSFHLDVYPGKIYASEILGIVGENGCGKSTFAKILAGKLKPDDSSKFQGINAIVSYKPQYITQNTSKSVRDFIIEQSQNYNFSEERMRILYKPLGVKKLLNESLSKLSGGELQRVYICACLAKKADLYILDEPSAYLDIEERIHIGQIIRTVTKRNNAVSICIEHDIQIADALIDRLLLFAGKPGVYGKTIGPLLKKEGMNKFLKSIDVSFRRDPKTGRARLNKKGSQLDRNQQASGQPWGINN
ncbi:MAG: ribosome biogenesis/translation initiation ATPase RLI [Candidatus Lokiarchaeota archaeon]|nr:ribosome biogenesis/translation initiation ATPase RLI [Candidatus Lokiarchaeota archaeon]